jgi:exocyst complex protein 7
MSNFQRGLLGVEKEMLPIYKLTEKLRETQKNIELCVQELNIINENFNITQELSPILMSGSKFDQDAYIKALLKILACISFLETHRSYEGSSKALEQAKELLIQAQKKCKNDFLSAIGVILRGSRHEENGSLIWHKPNQESIQKVIQLLECLLDSHMDPMELVQEYAVQRLQAIKLFVSPEEQSFPFPIQKETIDSLQKRLNEIEVTLEAEKELSSMIFMKQNEELRHTAFCRTILPIFESLRQEIESSLKALKQQDVFQLLKVYALLEQRRLNKIEPLIQPPLLLQNPSTPCTDHTSSTTKPLDPWILVQIWSKTQEQLNQMTKYKLTNFLSEIIADHPGSLSMNSSTNGGGIFKDANVHPHTSHVSVSMHLP